DNKLKLSGTSAIHTLQTDTITPTPKKTAVILYNFDDRPGKPITVAQARDAVFTGANSANKYYQAASLGKISLAGVSNVSGGDVYGWIKINQYSTSCDLYSYYEVLKKAAANLGFDESKYDNVILMSPNPGCIGAA